MPITRAKLKELEKKILPDKKRAQAYFEIAVICEQEENHTEVEYIKELWKLWLEADNPKDLEKFAKAIWVRAPEQERDISVFGLDRTKGIKQRTDRMYQIIKEIFRDKKDT